MIIRSSSGGGIARKWPPILDVASLVMAVISLVLRLHPVAICSIPLPVTCNFAAGLEGQITSAVVSSNSKYISIHPRTFWVGSKGPSCKTPGLHIARTSLQLDCLEARLHASRVDVSYIGDLPGQR